MANRFALTVTIVPVLIIVAILAAFGTESRNKTSGAGEGPVGPAVTSGPRPPAQLVGKHLPAT